MVTEQKVIPPVLTPLRTDGTVDVASMEIQVRRMVAAGCTGVWVNGTTGEFWALSREQRRAAVESAVPAAAGTGMGVIAQIGHTATDLAVEYARDALAVGATSIAAITPYYLVYEPAELRDYYAAIAESTGIPAVLYHLPTFTKIALEPGTVLDLAGAALVSGIKDSSESVGFVRRLAAGAAARGVDLPVYIGGGALLDVSLLAGATGAMAAIANVIPGAVVRLVAAATIGDWATAAAVQADVVRVTDALRLPDRTSWGQLVVAMKAVLAMLGTIRSERCARPLRPLDDDERAHLKATALPLIEAVEARWAPPA